MLLLNPVLENAEFASPGNVMHQGYYSLADFLSGAEHVEGDGYYQDMVEGKARYTGAAMGAFLSFMFYPFAIMWNPIENYKEYYTHKFLFRSQVAMTLLFILNIIETHEDSEGWGPNKIIFLLYVVSIMTYNHIRYNRQMYGRIPVIVNHIAGGYIISCCIFIKYFENPIFPFTHLYFYTEIIFYALMVYAAPLH
jgi:hypothetical protein